MGEPSIDVTDMGFQCAECGVPTDVIHLRREDETLRFEPCGHRLPIEASGFALSGHRLSVEASGFALTRRRR